MIALRTRGLHVQNYRKLNVGVAGLGRAFSLMLPTFIRDERIRLVAAADPREEARARFATEFSAQTYQSVAELCTDPQIEVIYVATPHQHHAAHACLAAKHGKHVLVEKPMAITLPECEAMIAAAQAANVRLIVGHSHSFNAPIRQARELIASHAFGRVRMITALNFTDFLYRPRRPEELITDQGGGVIFSQAAHQVDIVRLLGGGLVRSVRAVAGAWDAARPTEGAYGALLTFDDGAYASLTYSGYAHFDSDEFCGWIGEMGRHKDPERYGTARQALQSVTSAEQEADLKSARNYGGRVYVEQDASAASSVGAVHQHFGVVLISCERADLRPMPTGTMIYEDRARSHALLPDPIVPRSEVIDELYDAVVNGQPPIHSGEWSLASIEVCLALLRSSREQREVLLQYQVPVSR